MQTELDVQVPPRGGQLYEILMYLKNGGRLTVAKALQELDVFALSQRVGDLKRMGWPIHSEMVEVRSGKRVAEYWLE